MAEFLRHMIWGTPRSRVRVTYSLGEDSVAAFTSHWLDSDAALEDMVRRFGGSAVYLSDASPTHSVAISIEVESEEEFAKRQAYYEQILVERVRKEVLKRPGLDIVNEAREFRGNKFLYEVWIEPIPNANPVFADSGQVMVLDSDSDDGETTDPGSDSTAEVVRVPDWKDSVVFPSDSTPIFGAIGRRAHPLTDKK